MNKFITANNKQLNFNANIVHYIDLLVSILPNTDQYFYEGTLQIKHRKKTLPHVLPIQLEIVKATAFNVPNTLSIPNKVTIFSRYGKRDYIH